MCPVPDKHHAQVDYYIPEIGLTPTQNGGGRGGDPDPRKTIAIVECDEHEHNRRHFKTGELNYLICCEVTRMLQVSEAIGKLYNEFHKVPCPPITWIRYNPDDSFLDGEGVLISRTDERTDEQKQKQAVLLQCSV
jgi:hypothetical protein